jgi:hypothetical protein
MEIDKFSIHVPRLPEVPFRADDVAILYRTHGDTELTQPTRCVR